MDEKYIYGLVGMLMAASLAYIRDLLTEKRARKKEAEYLAIRMVCIFDSFMEGCAKVAKDDGLVMGQRNHNDFLDFQATLPHLEIQLSDVNWKAIPPLLMYEILSFPNIISDANAFIDSVFEYVMIPEDQVEGFIERQYQYALLGLKADELSKKLRQKYKVPQRQFNGWDVIDSMTKKKNATIKYREVLEARNRDAPEIVF